MVVGHWYTRVDRLPGRYALSTGVPGDADRENGRRLPVFGR
jgi:hypothetical protein